MDNKINIGIIGFGRMGITHHSIINSHPDVEITAIADASGMVLSLLKKYIPQIHTYTDYVKMLDEEERLDGILVCTPPQLHYPVVKLCAEKGIHVFAEKPFTTDAGKAAELAGLFIEKGLVNQVGYVNRYNDVFSAARKYMQAGVIGDLVRFRSEMFSRTVTEPEKGSNWRSKRESGGGVVYEMASHAIDLIIYIMGKPEKVTGSSMQPVFSKEIEDAVSSTLLYPGGVSGTLYVNWSDDSYRKPTNKIEFFGKKGKILADQHSMKVYMREENRDFGLNVGWNTRYITDLFQPVPFYVRGNEFTRQLYDFVDAIRGKKEILCSFSDGSKTLEVIDQLYDDFNTNGKIG